MSFSMFKCSASGALLAWLGMAFLPGTAQAANLLTATNAPAREPLHSLAARPG